MPELIKAAKLVKAAILGARGYVGVELIQLLDEAAIAEFIDMGFVIN